MGVALRPVGLGCGIRGGYGVVCDLEKGQTRPNQPLHLTGAALRRFWVQRLSSGPGRRTLPLRRRASVGSTEASDGRLARVGVVGRMVQA